MPQDLLEQTFKSVQTSGSPVVASAVSTEFWKDSMDKVIDLVAADFAKQASLKVMALASVALEKRMRGDLRKLTHAKIEEMHADSSESTKKGKTT